MSQPYDLTTVDAVKDTIQLPDGDSDLDVLIPEYISQASTVIMEYCEREFAPLVTNVTRRFKVDGYRVDFSPYDLNAQTVPTITLHPETVQPVILSTNQYMLKPINPQRGVYQSIQFSGYLVIISQTLIMFNYALVDITGDWGFSTVPDAVQRATNITVASWLTRTAPGASGPYGIPGMIGTGAQTYRNDWHIPWAAVKILGKYKRGSARWAF